MSIAEQVAFFVGLVAGAFSAWLIVTLTGIEHPVFVLGVAIVLGFVGADSGRRVWSAWTGEP